ncbi:hypothetical protein ACHAWO_011325 [Cyclotella atomus]|uniref:SGNH domain-containing protein n=1 Tax=Cyclotella atomus TaxID=382360 RepID=A0ABD3N109_9STRA
MAIPRRKRVLIIAAFFILMAWHSMNAPEPTKASYSTPFHHPLFHQSIPINRETPIAADVESIVHIADEAKILVYLHSNRTTCIEPQLIGRLSGYFLSKIKWSYQHVTNHNVIVGRYTVPSPGNYFLEIIATMCQALDMDTDATNVCLIDPSQHRLTMDNATLDAALITTNNNNNAEGIGFWYNKNEVTMDTTDATSSIKPLFTRYQPQNCRGDNAALDRCKIPTDVTRFDPYEFQFNSQFFLNDEYLKGKEGRLCFIGASHSRVLARFANQISNNIHVLQVDHRYVANLTQSEVGYASKCGKVVIGMGQWDAGHHGMGPTSFRELKKEMNRAMLEFVKPLLDANVSVYFRNMHYNPLGDLITQCPPADWRNPNVVDTYNIITKELCNEFQVPFIDTTDITGIMWDRQEDWAHFKDISGELEARYFLYRVFS